MDKKILALALATLMGLMPLASADDISMTADVQKYITATFSYSTVSFGNVLADGYTAWNATDQFNGVYNVTIDTNYDFYVEAYGTNFTSNGNSFPITRLCMRVVEDLDTLFPEGGCQGATTIQETPVNVGPGNPPTVTLQYHGFRISNIPVGTPAGSYSSTVTITYGNQ
jgi:hypothetical protein